MRVWLILAVAAVSAVARPAAAEVVTIAVTGTVQWGLDGNGLFGPPRQGLAGQAFTLDFAYDTTDALSGGNTNQANGGTLFNRPSPIVRGNITINGTTLSVIDPYYASYARFQYTNQSILTFGTGGPNGVNGVTFQWSRPDQSIPLALNAPVTRVFDASDTVYGFFQRGNPQLTTFSLAQLTPQSITVAVLGAAVPEPGTWALLIVGFGAVGAGMRRERTGRTRRSASRRGAPA